MPTRFQLSLLAAVIAAAGAVHAQNFPGGYQCVLPPTDTAASAFLPVFPQHALQAEDLVGVGPDGHFAAGGKTIRFFGTNCVADGAFPPKEYAWFIAGRLRKMGFNLVRFHHMDNPWTSGSLFVQNTDTRHLNIAALDRLEYFLSELKKNGIYADINLHVARTFRKSDGVPYADSLGEFGKGFTLFDPTLLALQKEFARQLLTHTNPYTGISLAHDPVMGMVEITNENSLYRFWHDGLLKPFSAGGVLPVYHQRLLDSLWQDYLTEKYATTAMLAAAWDSAAMTEGANLVRNGSFDQDPAGSWLLEQNQGATGVITRDLQRPYTSPLSAKVIVTRSNGIDWHVQFKQTGLSVVKDTMYTVRFAARADSARTISVNVMLEASPWTTTSWSTVTLDTSWKVFSVTFRATATWAGTVRLSFGVGAAIGTYWFDEVELARSGVKGLQPGESLEQRTVRRLDFAECGEYSDARVGDISGFYIRLQKQYFATMRSFLRDSLGVRVPIVGTNWNFGIQDLAVQSEVDYVDNHSYWDHPTFPSVPWSSTDWKIANTPMVSATGGGTIGNLMAGAPMADKPYTISEYNHAFPNQYQSEGPLFLTAYAAFHGADAIMFFDYNSGPDWITDRVSGYFDIHRNTAMMALMPSLAAAYRKGLIAPAQQTILLRWTADDVLLQPKRDDRRFWTGPPAVPRELALQHAVRTESYAARTSSFSSTFTVPSVPYLTDTKEILWDPAGLLTVGTPSFAAATGIVPHLTASSAGDLRILSGAEHCTTTWIALDHMPLSISRHTLLTLVTRVENTGMVWDGTTTFHDAWGTPPTLMQPTAVSFRFHIAADSIRVVPLSTVGLAASGGMSVLPADTNTFVVTIDQSVVKTPWFGIEAFGQGVVSGMSETKQVPLEWGLEQCYPNPFNPVTTIGYTVGGIGDRGPGIRNVKLSIYNLLGQEVAVLVNEKQVPGRYTVRFDGSKLASGVYLYRLQAGSYVETKRMLLLK